MAVLLVVSLSFAGNLKPDKAKTIDPSSEVAEGLNKLPAKNMSKVTASQLGFTDYDYAGNSGVNEQVWPYDIDGDGVLDPVAVWMQRFNTSEDGTRRVMISVGLGGEFASFDASDRTLYTGWGVVQSISAGPWAGHAAIMMHEGGEAKLTVYNLTDFSTVYFHEDMNLDDNFPNFAYMEDGSIVATLTDGLFYDGSTADPMGYTENGQAMVVGPSEYPVRMSPNGEYLAAVSDDGGVEVRLYTSNDGGASWTDELIGENEVSEIVNRPGALPLFTNFGQATLAVDNNGVVHVGMNGYSLLVDGADTSFTHPALYWNSRDRNWVAVSDPAEEGEELSVDGVYPGNGIGNAYPTPIVSEDGSVVSVLYQAPEYDAGTLQVYPGDGGPETGANYYTDIKHAYSEDGGVTFSTPEVVAGNPGESDVYPAAYDWLIQDGNEYTVHFMWMTDAIPGTSLFTGSGENGESEDTYWSYETVTFTAEPSSVEDDEELANTFTLQQNYPNPFNPTTTIKYSVPELANVSLKVYDVLGKEVATLVDAEQVGVQEVEFDASNLASGLYIYTLKAGSFTSTKKMMLMK